MYCASGAIVEPFWEDKSKSLANVFAFDPSKNYTLTVRYIPSESPPPTKKMRVTIKFGGRYEDVQQIIAADRHQPSNINPNRPAMTRRQDISVGQNKMKIRLLSLLILASPCLATDSAYIVKMIDCEPREEILISKTYESFLDLIAKREVKKEELRFPVRLAAQNDKGVIFSRSFYVSPNELRGFEIFIPKDCVQREERNICFYSRVGCRSRRDKTRHSMPYTQRGVVDGKLPETPQPHH